MKKSKEGKPEGQPEKRPRVYWDTCIFIHYLKATGEPGVDEQFRLLNARELTAATSALTLVELLECDIPEERKHLLEILKGNPDKLTIVQVGLKEAYGAHDIRNHYKQNENRRIGTPDAVHLATAILNECDALYTLDDKLHKLSGAGVLYGLKIEAPPHPPAPAQAPLIDLDESLLNEQDRPEG